jgi:hypothetical protein
LVITASCITQPFSFVFTLYAVILMSDMLKSFRV